MNTTTTTTTTVNNPWIVVVIVAVFAVILIAVIVGAIKRREEVFEGEVIDKNIIEAAVNNMPTNNMNNGITFGNANMGGIQHEYKIKVRTSVGKTINYKISSGMYEVIKIGDMVSKPKGTTQITIVSSKPVDSPSGSSTTSTPAPTIPGSGNPTLLV